LSYLPCNQCYNLNLLTNILWKNLIMDWNKLNWQDYHFALIYLKVIHLRLINKSIKVRKNLATILKILLVRSMMKTKMRMEMVEAVKERRETVKVEYQIKWISLIFKKWKIRMWFKRLMKEKAACKFKLKKIKKIMSELIEMIDLK